ncbi:MAG: circularly permuted type 2 ATP-grasp protein, partial [Caulobacteraceae bacterium]
MSGGGGSDEVRPSYRTLSRWLKDAPPDLLTSRSRQAELFFRRMGVTFAVYGDVESNERLIPFDVVPRIIGASEWASLEKGLIQRVEAINAFLRDVYGPQDCIRAGIIPAELVLTNPNYRPEMQGRRPPGDVWTHICGVDLVRTGEDGFYVLEDNCRTPSGVSYMLENREMMMRLFPDLFAEHRIRPVETYTDTLLASLQASAPDHAGADPTVVVLTPGPYNSAYYEHSFLADKLGVELVEGGDLFVSDDVVYMRTTEGPRRVDVIYRRVDDDFLDPLTFRADSAVGIPGVMAAYAAGNVTLANAVGTGVADDKAVYTYMPDIIRFFSGEEPILKNVPTWRCREPDALKQV